MSETLFVYPHPSCRKTITRTRPTDAPEQCPHCGQPLDAAPPPAAGGDPFQTAGPPSTATPKPPSTNDANASQPDAFATAAEAAEGVPFFVPPDDQPLQIGRFHIRKKLGAGAFGIVYRAHDPQLDREVALKVAKPHMLTTRESVKRFLREAKAAAHLRHTNIVCVHDSGQDGEHYFIASAFIPGRTLADAVHASQGRGLELREAAQIIRRIAEALAYAHRKGIVHRDVKPANVLLDEQGEPMLTDFGLATIDEGHERITQDGTQMMGTPAYMAPEQAQGKAETASDQYSLGVTLYELLTGRLPFAGDVLEQIEQHKSKEPPSPRTLMPALPRDLETICLKALAKKPADRYGDCQALADDLRRWLEGEPITARRLSLVERAWRWGRKNPALAALVLVTLLGVAGIVWKYIDAEQQKAIALREADKAAQASAYLASIFELAIPSRDRDMPTPRQILDEAEKRIPQQFQDQPELRDKLLQQIGTVYDKMTANAPLAMLLEVRGTVQLQSSRNAKAKAVPQTLLYTGDRLALAPDAHVLLVVLSDLHKERLRPGSEVTIRRQGCEPADAVSARDPDVLMTFVKLPKGTFYMGWDGDKKGVKTEIAEDFEIAVHDVTQGQWEAIMGNNPSYFSRFGGGRNEIRAISDEELRLFPVESVSWDDAQEFIKKLNEKKRGSGYLYRLPTAAEWEYACRGGATSEEECSFHFYFATPTNDLSSDQANFDGNNPFGKAPKGKWLRRTTRVGAYPSNKLGLCDMHGNVWQWTATSEGSDRVLRGGSWHFNGDGCRAASRNGDSPSSRFFNIGFRLARVPRPATK